MDWLLSAIGLVILLLAGDALVKGAVNLSLRLGVPALIVSLTIVAFGTSAPELLIAIRATLDNAPGIALGNVVGSNTANILLVLGIPAIISVLDTSNCDSRKIYGFMLLATLLFICCSKNAASRWIITPFLYIPSYYLCGTAGCMASTIARFAYSSISNFLPQSSGVSATA